MWVMSNEISKGFNYLNNGKWYAVEDPFEEWVSFKDDNGKLVCCKKRGSSVLSGGDWNISFIDPHEDEIQQNKFTTYIIDGLNNVLDNNGYLYEEEFLQSLIDKLRSGEYTITHEI